MSTPSEKARAIARDALETHMHKCSERCDIDEHFDQCQDFYAARIDALVAEARAEAMEECLNLSAICAACGGHKVEQVQVSEDESDFRHCTNCAGTGYTYDEFIPQQIRALAAKGKA